MLFFLDVYGTYRYMGILLGFCIFIWFPLEFLKIKMPEMVLILFGITYVIFASFNVQLSVPTIYAFILLPLIIFKIGKLSSGFFRKEKNIFLFLAMSLVALAFLVSYSVLISFLNEGVIGSRRPEIMYYDRTGQASERTATLVGLHIVPLMSFLPLYFFQRKGELAKYFFIGSFLTILAILVTTLTATRTPIVILTILLFVNFYVGMKNLSYFSKAVILAIFFLAVYSVTFIEFANFELTSLIYERFTDDDIYEAGSRKDMWLLGIENIFKYPFGGESLQISYFHNLWLDLRHVAGVVPMIFLILLSLNFTFICWKLSSSSLFSIQLKAFLVTVYLSLFLMMFMEPILQGSFVFFLYYVFFGGVLIALKDVKHN